MQKVQLKKNSIYVYLTIYKETECKLGGNNCFYISNDIISVNESGKNFYGSIAAKKIYKVHVNK